MGKSIKKFFNILALILILTLAVPWAAFADQIEGDAVDTNNVQLDYTAGDTTDDASSPLPKNDYWIDAGNDGNCEASDGSPVSFKLMATNNSTNADATSLIYAKLSSSTAAPQSLSTFALTFDACRSISTNAQRVVFTSASSLAAGQYKVEVKPASIADGGSDTYTISGAHFQLNVSASTNAAPAATNDAVTVNEDSQNSPVDVLANDTDGDDDSLTVTAVGAASNGTSRLNNGAVDYTPNANYFGSDSFTYTISDGKGGTATGTVNVTVTSINDAPSFAKGANQAVNEDAGAQSVAGWATNISKGPANEGTQTVQFLVSNDNNALFTSGGQPAIAANGTLTYTAKADASGSATVTVQIKDDGGTAHGGVDTSAAQSFTITVTAVNDAPVAQDDTASTDEDTNLTIQSSRLLGNDTDVDEDKLSITSVTGGAATHGTVTLSEDKASILYNPTSNYNGEATFTYTVSDGNGGTDTATVTITVTAVNDAPEVGVDTASVTVNEGQTASNTGTWSDVDGDTVSLSASLGTIHRKENGTWSWSYDSTDDLATTVTITANDGQNKPNSERTVTFTLTVTNVAPTATFNAPESVNEGSAIALSLSGADDASSADKTAGFSYRFDCGTGYGAWGTSSSVSCATTDNGTRNVSAQIKDKDGGISEYTASVRIDNVAPNATITGAPAASSLEGTQISLDSTVSDPGSADTHTYAWSVKKGDAAYGSTGSDKSFSFTPNDNGTYVVTLVVTDDDKGADTETATINVTNADPTAKFNAPASVDEGSGISLSLTAPQDASSADTEAGFKYYFDCGTGAGYVLSADNSASCTTSDDETRTVKGKIVDKDGGETQYTESVQVSNVNPGVNAGANGTSAEGSEFSRSISFTDPGADTWTATINWGDGTAAETKTLTSRSFNIAHAYGDNGEYTVTVSVKDDNNGEGTASFKVAVSNVAPTTSNPQFTFNPVTREATVSFEYKDAGWLDTHTASTFRWSIDSADRQATLSNTENIAPDASGKASDSRILPVGCYTLTVTGVARDDDGGASAEQGIVSSQKTDAYKASFKAPIMDNERNIAKYGNVVPVKVVLESQCSPGTTVTDQSLYITLAKGVNGEYIESDNLIAESVSSADSGSQMRTADGMYIYNLSTKNLTANTDYAVRIRQGSTTGPIILQAVLYPKK